MKTPDFIGSARNVPTVIESIDEAYHVCAQMGDHHCGGSQPEEEGMHDDEEDEFAGFTVRNGYPR